MEIRVLPLLPKIKRNKHCFKNVQVQKKYIFEKKPPCMFITKIVIESL